MRHMKRLSKTMPQKAFIEKGFRILIQFGDVDRRWPDEREDRRGKWIWFSF